MVGAEGGSAGMTVSLSRAELSSASAFNQHCSALSGAIVISAVHFYRYFRMAALLVRRSNKESGEQLE
jgi:hypothetical protein